MSAGFRKDDILSAACLNRSLLDIHGNPSLPTAQTRVYFDIEALPDRDFLYLIGALRVHGSEVMSRQFWGDEEIVHHHIYFPTYSNGLKEIGRYVGATRSIPEASGRYSVLWRELWEQSGQAAFKSRLLQYNHEDCLALRSLQDFIADVIERTPGNASEQYIVRTGELPKSPTKWPTYGRDVFQLREFERINECAYFDYQREHVDKDTAAVGTPPAKALHRNGQNGK